MIDRRALRVVAAREFRERARSKPFIVSTVMLLLLVVAAILVPALVLGTAAHEHIRHVGVVRAVAPQV
ncbi:MAG: hypothetical protein M3245_03595, partial [Actinomycetota bacterium]|nr:hypothetical protein [Actinomycetota bacterium]